MCLLKLLGFLTIFSVALGGEDTVPKSGVPLITGGSDTHNQDYSKNIVSLRFGNLPENYWGANHFCGGTFIGKDVVLTAAHCLVDLKTMEALKPHELIVVTGSPYRLKKTPTTIELKVREVIPHELFSKELLQYDIGLIILELRATELFKESAEILRINKTPLEGNTRCTIAGWGKIFTDGLKPPILLYVNVTVWSLIHCQVKHPSLIRLHDIICVNDDEDTHLTGSACMGDSGGPLICNGRLAGITSFITGACGEKGYPTVYTDVNYYHRWIERNSADKSEMPPFVAVVILASISIGCIIL